MLLSIWWSLLCCPYELQDSLSCILLLVNVKGVSSPSQFALLLLLFLQICICTQNLNHSVCLSLSHTTPYHCSAHSTSTHQACAWVFLSHSVHHDVGLCHAASSQRYYNAQSPRTSWLMINMLGQSKLFVFSLSHIGQFGVGILSVEIFSSWVTLACFE